MQASCMYEVYIEMVEKCNFLLGANIKGLTWSEQVWCVNIYTTYPVYNDSFASTIPQRVLADTIPGCHPAAAPSCLSQFI